MAISVALLIAAWSIPQAVVSLILIAAALVSGVLGVITAMKARREPDELDDNPELFRTAEAESDYLQRCAQCGEVFGLGIKVCPRCKRPVAPLA